jgi:AhpD family alkylhydroperoxidase
MNNDTAKSEVFPPADLASLPDDIRESLLAVQVKAGFVPNVFLKLARRPAEFRAFVAYHDALMLKEEPASPATGGARTRGALETGALTKGDREMIVVATSAAANCLYCVVSHGALLRIYEKKPLVADQVAVNYRKADITPRQRAMLDFAMKVSLESHTISEADFQPLRAHGFNDEDVWDIAAISAFFAMSNRLANALNMMPNDDFYLMGRVPRAKK